MKILFERFVKALEEYAEDSRSVVKRATQEQAIKAVKLDLANDLKHHLQTVYLGKNEFVCDDYDALIQTIETIQKEVGEKRDGRKIEPGYFDALLEWMSDRLNAAKVQAALPLVDESIRLTLSDTQYLIKNNLDEFIVLLGGFSSFPDNRNKIEVWAKYHPRVAVYPVEAGWDERALSTEEKVASIAEQVEALKQATLFQLRNQADDQMKATLYYMTVAELSKISPILAPLSQYLIQTLDLKPLVLKKEKAVEQESVAQENAEIRVDEVRQGDQGPKKLSVQVDESLDVETEKKEPSIPRHSSSNSLIFSTFGIGSPPVQQVLNLTVGDVAKIVVTDDVKQSGGKKNKLKN